MKGRRLSETVSERAVRGEEKSHRCCEGPEEVICRCLPCRWKRRGVEVFVVDFSSRAQQSSGERCDLGWFRRAMDQPDEALSVKDRIRALQASATISSPPTSSSPRTTSNGHAALKAAPTLPQPRRTPSLEVQPPLPKRPAAKDSSSPRKTASRDPLTSSPTELSIDSFPSITPSPASSRPSSPAHSLRDSPRSTAAPPLPSRSPSSSSPGLSYVVRSSPSPKPALSLVTAPTPPAVPSRSQTGPQLISFESPVGQKASAPWQGKVTLQPPSPDPGATKAESPAFRSAPVGNRSFPPVLPSRPIADSAPNTPTKPPILPPRPRGGSHAHSASMQSVSLSDAGSEVSNGGISEEELARKRYDALYESLRPNGRQAVPSTTAAQVWARSRLDRQTLGAIWCVQAGCIATHCLSLIPRTGPIASRGGRAS